MIVIRNALYGKVLITHNSKVACHSKWNSVHFLTNSIRSLCKIPKIDLISRCGNLWKRTFSAEFPQNIHTRKLVEITIFTVFYVWRHLESRAVLNVLLKFYIFPTITKPKFGDHKNIWYVFNTFMFYYVFLLEKDGE